MAADGCHHDHQRGGHHCHRGGDGEDDLAVSFNLLAGVRPVIKGQYYLSVGGLIGARRAPIVDHPEDEMHWRANYGGIVGLQVRSVGLGVRWTPEGVGVVLTIGGPVGAVYLFGGEKMGGFGGFANRGVAPLCWVVTWV